VMAARRGPSGQAIAPAVCEAYTGRDANPGPTELEPARRTATDMIYGGQLDDPSRPGWHWHARYMGTSVCAVHDSSLGPLPVWPMDRFKILRTGVSFQGQNRLDLNLPP
jgi:hypothetical protein